jgi:transcriptional regulator
MYNPPLFREERVPVLHQMIREHGLATLVTLGPDGLTADHLPMELDADAGPLGTLIGHVSRANPVWRRPAGDVEALAVFHGPQSYITPAWYETKRETGKVVPTWNYVVVHAHGRIRAIEDRAWLRALVERLTNRYESDRSDPWHVTDAPEDFIEGLLKSIVGIEMPIARIEGKWKVSQNRPAADRDGVAAGLRTLPEPRHRMMARLVDGGAPSDA